MSRRGGLDRSEQFGPLILIKAATPLRPLEFSNVPVQRLDNKQVIPINALCP
jgi:hypothetical protein